MSYNSGFLWLGVTGASTETGIVFYPPNDSCELRTRDGREERAIKNRVRSGIEWPPPPSKSDLGLSEYTTTTVYDAVAHNFALFDHQTFCSQHWEKDCTKMYLLRVYRHQNMPIIPKKCHIKKSEHGNIKD